MKEQLLRHHSAISLPALALDFRLPLSSMQLLTVCCRHLNVSFMQEKAEPLFSLLLFVREWLGEHQHREVTENECLLTERRMDREGGRETGKEGRREGGRDRCSQWVGE